MDTRVLEHCTKMYETIMPKPSSKPLMNEEYPVGGWISIGHPAIAELYATLGHDFAIVDTEHTPMSLETVEGLVRAVEAAGDRTETIVRVPDDDAARIKRVLDIGVSGIMVPMIETATEARAVVEACRYPPDGTRGIAAGRASDYGVNFPEYVENAGDSVTVVVQIETEAGLENVETIAGVEGVDSLLVGPADLSGALGVFAEWDSPALGEAIDRVLEAGDRTGVPIGTLALEPDDIDARVEQGFDYLIVGTDASYLQRGMIESRERYERAVDRSEGR
jgi:2-dehydro-3-deoxyglucarate aldolase/4-hydroxy-2-oxoheptanedioate aldolase